MLASRLFRPLARPQVPVLRGLSTLAANPSIKVFPNPQDPSNHLLTYLTTIPPNPSLAIGTTTTLPPTPNSFRGNPRFMEILNDVLARYAPEDSGLKSQAQAFASPGGTSFVIQGRNPRRGSGTGGAGGASAEGGAGGAGVGGWVHLSDSRNPPDFGRIAWPEDIFGSVEVNGKGEIIGNFQPSGTYRIVTNQGILGLSKFLEEKLIERLQEEEKKAS